VVVRPLAVVAAGAVIIRDECAYSSHRYESELVIIWLSVYHLTGKCILRHNNNAIRH
jgi:hypothetical protein